MRTLIAIMIIALDGELSSAFARKASRHHPDCAASNHQSAIKADPGGVARHHDKVALDRKIGSICRRAKLLSRGSPAPSHAPVDHFLTLRR